MKYFVCSFAAMLLACGNASAATNLIVNGGFETGNTAGWFGGGATVEPRDYGPPHSGTYQALFGSVGYLNGISQTIATMPGQTYDFSFYWHNDGGTPSEFIVTFGDTSILDVIDPPLSDYMLVDTKVVATSDLTTVSFTGRNDPSWVFLDDVSVTGESSVPEAPTWTTLIVGLGFLGTAMRRRKVVIGAV